MNLTLRWHIHVSVHSVLYTSTHTRILKPFEDSEPTGLRSANFVPFVMVVLRVGVQLLYLRVRHEWGFLMDYFLCLAAA